VKTLRYTPTLFVTGPGLEKKKKTPKLKEGTVGLEIKEKIKAQYRRGKREKKTHRRGPRAKPTTESTGWGVIGRGKSQSILAKRRQTGSKFRGLSAGFWPGGSSGKKTGESHTESGKNMPRAQFLSQKGRPWRPKITIKIRFGVYFRQKSCEKIPWPRCISPGG